MVGVSAQPCNALKPAMAKTNSQRQERINNFPCEDSISKQGRFRKASANKKSHGHFENKPDAAKPRLVVLNCSLSLDSAYQNSPRGTPSSREQRLRRMPMSTLSEIKRTEPSPSRPSIWNELITVFASHGLSEPPAIVGELIRY